MDFSQFTQEELQKAREYAAGFNLRCAEAIKNNDSYNMPFADHVTDEDKQKAYNKHMELASSIKQGKKDNNSTVRWRMYYYLTGESIALLP